MSKHNQSPISDRVMAQLKQGKVHMRPRMYFTLLMAAAVFATVLSAITLAYVISIVFFWLRIQTADSMAWGARANLNELINSFPWWALVVGVGMFALTVWLVHRQGTMYRHKISTIIIVIASVSILLGTAFTYFGIGSSHYQNRRLNDSQLQRGPGWQQNDR